MMVVLLLGLVLSVANAQTQPAVPPGGLAVGSQRVAAATWNFDGDLSAGSGPWQNVTVTNTNCDTPYRPGTAQAGAIIFTAPLTLVPAQTGLKVYVGDLLPFTGTRATGHVRVLTLDDAEPTTHVDATVSGLDDFALDNTFSVCLTAGEPASSSSTPAPTVVTFASGACGAAVPEATVWHGDNGVVGELRGGLYAVRTATLGDGRGWLEVYAAEAIDGGGGQGFVWVDASADPIRLDPSCVYSSGLGAVPPPDASEAGPPGPTQDLSYPYGSCVVQQVPPGALASWSVQEAPSVPLGSAQYIVARATRVSNANWLGIYGGPQGEVVWLPTNTLLAPDGSNVLRLTASCLVVPEALAAAP